MWVGGRRETISYQGLSNIEDGSFLPVDLVEFLSKLDSMCKIYTWLSQSFRGLTKLWSGRVRHSPRGAKAKSVVVERKPGIIFGSYKGKEMINGKKKKILFNKIKYLIVCGGNYPL